VTAPTDVPAFFRSLPELVGEGAVLYLEGTRIDEGAAAYLSQRQAPHAQTVPRSTLWPRPQCFHMPATEACLDGLASLSAARGGDPTADHVTVYRDGRMLLTWYDAFCGDEVYLSKEIAESAVAAFCERVGSTFRPFEGSSQAES